MKEASGEANLTVTTIILIGVIVAVATPLINSMLTSTAKRTCCQNYGGAWKGNKCYEVATGGGVSNSEITNYWSNGKCAE